MNLEKFIEKNHNKLVEIHWNETINQYAKNMTLSKIILEDLKGEKYFETLAESFKNINKEIDRYLQDISNPTYQIAIVGAIKAGKSTLINALIGYELASVDVTPETATLTKFSYADKNILKIKFYSEKEWDSIWKNAKDKKAEKFLEEYEELKAEEIKLEYLNHADMEQTFSTLDEMKAEIIKWTSSKKKEHFFVKELDIGLKDLNLPKQVSLVDTPGLNDVVDYRSKITTDYIGSANAVIVCVNAKTLRNDEVLTLSKVFSKARYKEDKIYVLGTQIDTMNSYDDWLKQKENWIDTLKTFYKKSDTEIDKRNARLKAKTHLLGISAWVYNFKNQLEKEKLSRILRKLYKTNILNDDECDELEEKLDNNRITQKDIEELKNKIIEFSKIEKLNKIIKEDLLKNFNEAMFKDFIENYKELRDEIDSFKNKEEETLKEKKKELGMSSDEINEKIKLEQEKMRNFEEITKKLENSLDITVKEFQEEFQEVDKFFNNMEENIKKINLENKEEK